MVGVPLAGCGLASSYPQPSASKPASGFNSALKSSDEQFLLQLSISPNRYGSNRFTVEVKNVGNGKQATGALVQIFATMLDMDMGTDVLILPSNGNGRYSPQGELAMDGNWRMGIQVQLPDGTVHVAVLKLFTPS